MKKLYFILFLVSLNACGVAPKIDCQNNYVGEYQEVVKFDNDKSIFYDFDEAMTCLRSSENSYKGLRVHFLIINGGDRPFLIKNYFNKNTETNYYSLKKEYLTVFLILDLKIPLIAPYVSSVNDTITDLMAKNSCLCKQWNVSQMPCVVTFNKEGEIISQESLMMKFD